MVLLKQERAWPQVIIPAKAEIYNHTPPPKASMQVLWSPVDIQSLGNGYIIQRIYDIVCLNTGSEPLGLQTNTVWTCGDAVYSDGAAGVQFTTAYLMQWDWQGSTIYPRPMVNLAQFPSIVNWANR